MYEYCYSNLGAIYGKGLCPRLRSAQSLKIECKSLNSPRDSVNISVFWGKYRECLSESCLSDDVTRALR